MERDVQRYAVRETRAWSDLQIYKGRSVGAVRLQREHIAEKSISAWKQRKEQASEEGLHVIDEGDCTGLVAVLVDEGKFISGQRIATLLPRSSAGF